MNDEQGTRGSKHGTDNVSRSPTHPKHTTTTPTNRGKGCSERKRKAEESVEELKQLQAKEAEAQTAENAAQVVAEEAAKRTTTAEDASNGTGARESDGDPSPDASEAEWVKAVLKDAETAAKALATNRAAALEADQAEKAHCRHVEGLPCDNHLCNFFVCLRQQQLRAYVMRHPTKPKPEEEEETLCYNYNQTGHSARQYADEKLRRIQWCSNCEENGHRSRNCPQQQVCFNCKNPGHQKRECSYNNEWQTAAPAQEWPQEQQWPATAGEQKEETVCYNCNQTGHKAYQCPEKKDNEGWRGKGGKAGKGPWPCERCNTGSSHKLEKCPTYNGCETCGRKDHMAWRCPVPRNQ
jgi:hypothetical protein